MEKVCTDSVFGIMTYRHQWYKNETMVLFGKKYDVKVAAQAYSGKDITDEERKGYQYIKEHWTTLQKDIWKALSDYVSENVQDITTYCPESIYTRRIYECSNTEGIVMPVGWFCSFITGLYMG